MTSVPRRQQSLVVWPGAAKLLIRCLSLNAFSGVSPHPHARQVGFESRASWARAQIFFLFSLLHHSDQSMKMLKFCRALPVWKKEVCMEEPLPIVVATTRLRTTHCVSAARSPPDHFPALQAASTLYKSPLLRTVDQRTSVGLERKYVCLGLTRLRIFKIDKVCYY